MVLYCVALFVVTECRGFESHLRQLIFLSKKELSWVLLYCVALFVVSCVHHVHVGCSSCMVVSYNSHLRTNNFPFPFVL